MKRIFFSAAVLLLTLLLAVTACAEFSFGSFTWDSTPGDLEAAFPDAIREEVSLFGTDRTVEYSVCTADTETMYVFVNGHLWAIYDMNENGFGTDVWTGMYDRLVGQYGEPGDCEDVLSVFFQVYGDEEHANKWHIDENTAVLLVELDGWTVVIYENMPLFDELLEMAGA